VKLIGANLLDAQPIRRAVEETAELRNRVNVGFWVAGERLRTVMSSIIRRRNAVI
jgi:hypothetical protein